MIPRKDWTSADYLAYVDGWSNARLGYPAAPPDRDIGRAANVSATLSHVVGGAPAHVVGAMQPETRRAMLFSLGHREALAA